MGVVGLWVWVWVHAEQTRWVVGVWGVGCGVDAARKWTSGPCGGKREGGRETNGRCASRVGCGRVVGCVGWLAHASIDSAL